MRSAIFFVLLAVAGFISVPAHAQPAAPLAAPTTPITDLEVMVVSGVQPGPGMWKVSRGDHVLWVLGVQSPLPRNMQWHSPEVEAAIAQSQELLEQPGLMIGVSAGGMFRAMFAIPTLLKANKLADGKSLRDVLPPDLYLRWSQLKPLYLPDKQGVEQLRPVFAAQALYDSAVRQAGLEGGGSIADKVEELAKAHKLKSTPTGLSAFVTKPKAMAKSFARAPLDEIPCFRATLDRLDSDVAATMARANAWAVGDVAEMARLVGPNDVRTCLKTISEAEALRSLGLDNAEARIEAKWLAAAETALARNPSSFALLAVTQLLSANGYLASLQAKGYVVEAPQ